MQGRTSCYILQDEKVVLFEPSASPSIPHILEGLQELNIPLEKIDFIIVTHIHLDHAGGAGLLLEKCPNAKFVVHPKGAKHMTDPSKLIAAAKAVYGDDFERLFHPILPIPEERMLIKQHGESIEIGENSFLTFYDSPGHANHHFSIHDSVSNGIFTGDTIGVYYNELHNQGIEFYLPSTSPTQFNPEAMLQSAKMIEELNVNKIYFSHFGVSYNPQLVISELRKWLPQFVNITTKTLKDHPSEGIEQSSKIVEDELKKLVSTELRKHTITEDHQIYDILSLDLSICAMGLVDYLNKSTERA
jgi:glyoxylase-like metal-dependent hydrolase (beta-lactamase superfamily II)